MINILKHEQRASAGIVERNYDETSLDQGDRGFTIVFVW